MSTPVRVRRARSSLPTTTAGVPEMPMARPSLMSRSTRALYRRESRHRSNLAVSGMFTSRAYFFRSGMNCALGLRKSMK